MALAFALLDAHDRPGRPVQILFDQRRFDAGLQVDLFAGSLDQAGGKGRLACAAGAPRQFRLQGPVLDGNKLQDLPFAIDDYPYGDRLDAPGRQTTPNLLTQEGTDRVADQPIDDAPRLLGVDPIHVDAARALHGGEHRAFGDLVELDAIDLLVTVQAERGNEMPGNGLAFTIRVGG